MGRVANEQLFANIGVPFSLRTCSVRYRQALPRDLGKIISIHVRGSQQAYADILPAAYLDSVMPKEKIDLWRSRLGGGVDKSRLSVTVAEEADIIAGFVCFLFDQETDHGTYLHNIYVDRGYQRRGTASGLLIAGIDALLPDRRNKPVHLLVLAENAPARAFYERLGGVVIEVVERSRSGSEPVAHCRYQWQSADKLKENSLRLVSAVRP